MTEVGPVHLDLCEEHRKPIDDIVASVIGVPEITGPAPPSPPRKVPVKRVPAKKVARRLPRKTARRQGGTPIMTDEEIEQRKKQEAAARGGAAS